MVKVEKALAAAAIIIAATNISNIVKSEPDLMPGEIVRACGKVVAYEDLPNKRSVALYDSSGGHLFHVSSTKRDRLPSLLGADLCVRGRYSGITPDWIFPLIQAKANRGDLPIHPHKQNLLYGGSRSIAMMDLSYVKLDN